MSTQRSINQKPMFTFNSNSGSKNSYKEAKTDRSGSRRLTKRKKKNFKEVFHPSNEVTPNSDFQSTNQVSV